MSKVSVIKTPVEAPLSKSEARQIAREEIARVLLEVRRQLVGETDHFSTQGGDRHAPPEYQGRPKKWRTDAATVPGAVKVGRWWTVSREAYRSWLESKRTTPAPGLAAVPAPAAAWKPEDALVGLRAVGGGR
jgi:hypothetical protein